MINSKGGKTLALYYRNKSAKEGEKWMEAAKEAWIHGNKGQGLGFTLWYRGEVSVYIKTSQSHTTVSP